MLFFPLAFFSRAHFQAALDERWSDRAQTAFVFVAAFKANANEGLDS